MRARLDELMSAQAEAVNIYTSTKGQDWRCSQDTGGYIKTGTRFVDQQEAFLELRALRAQRDELLAVAQEAAEHYARLCGDDTSYTPLRARLERASAAIARATGKQEAQR